MPRAVCSVCLISFNMQAVNALVRLELQVEFYRTTCAKYSALGRCKLYADLTDNIRDADDWCCPALTRNVFQTSNERGRTPRRQRGTP